MQVPLEALARLVAGGDDSGARRRQLRLCVGVRDRDRDQLGEVAQPSLGFRRRRLVGRRCHDDEPPWTALDGDRRPDGGADAKLESRRARVTLVAVDAGRAPGLTHTRTHGARAHAAANLGCGAKRQRLAGCTPRGDERYGVVGVVSRHVRAVH